MSRAKRRIALTSGCVALLLMLVAGIATHVPPNVAAHTSCPPGQEPLEIASLGSVWLSEGAPSYARMALRRITLAPGETLDETPEGSTVYYVESGVLSYHFQPGFEIRSSPQCTSPDSGFSGGGSTHISSEGMSTVTQGQALVADLVPIGPITNGGDTPLVMLQMTLVSPEIDPATGLPIVDPATAARIASRQHERWKQACKEAARLTAAGTPVPDEVSAVIAEAASGTPTVSTAGWESDAGDSSVRPPKACRT